jgi:hypothetical protein
MATALGLASICISDIMVTTMVTTMGIIMVTTMVTMVIMAITEDMTQAITAPDERSAEMFRCAHPRRT